uniref:DAGKc domain-containing protein n=1 Tax=Ditylenchus dipsaci TaxID=166011 RepID=A0A915D9M2_9BILA
MEDPNGSASCGIYEGFIREIFLQNEKEDLNLTNGAVCCASWNTQNDFLHITALPKPFRIHFDDILCAEQVKDKLTLFTQILVNVKNGIGKRREAKNFELCFKDSINFYKEFSWRTQKKVSPHSPRNNQTKVLVLINPFSGQQKALDLWAQLAKPVFQQANILYETKITSERGHATKIAQEIDLDEFSAIGIVSGDGLVAEVILGLLTRKDRRRALKLPILHIPGGTSNALAASIAFQSNEPFPPRGEFCKEMALMMVRPRYRPLRLYHVQTLKNGQPVHMPMFMSMNWGLVADIDLGSERFRWAGMIRLHMEAFIRLIRLPSVAHYKGRISYLPKFIWESHLSVKTSVKEAFEGTYVLNGKVPSLDQPAPSNWEVIEGEFVMVCLSSMSHIGSDLPYMPCSRLEEEVFYLTFVDWRTVKSRLHMAHLLLTINQCSHLNHACLQTIPVLACRVEPAPGAGGYVALDGEPCESGAPFQVVSSLLQATVIARQARE